MCQASTCGWVPFQGRTQSAPKSGNQMFMLELKPCQCKIATDEIQEKKHYGERSAHVSALTGSVPRKMASALALTTQPLVHIKWTKKMVYDSSYYLNCFALLFLVQNCQSQIAQVEYQGEASNTRILKRKPMIDTSYRIQHRLELKLFHLLNAHQAARWPQKKWELITWDLGQIFKI